MIFQKMHLHCKIPAYPHSILVLGSLEPKTQTTHVLAIFSRNCRGQGSHHGLSFNDECIKVVVPL